MLKVNGDCQELGVGQEWDVEPLLMGGWMQGFFEGAENVLKLDLMMVAQLCKLYLSKPDLKQRSVNLPGKF